MVRQRHVPHQDQDAVSDRGQTHVRRSTSLQAKSKGKGRLRRTSSSALEFWLKVSALVTIFSVIGFFAYQRYWRSRLTTPMDAPQAVNLSGSKVSGRFWGSYRPGVYFGMKTRSPPDLLTGLMWMIPRLVKPGQVGLRHWCEQGDNLDTYGWIQHDGEHFGVHAIQDRRLNITTSFVKYGESQSDFGGSWTARVRVEASHPKAMKEVVSLFYYAALDNNAEDADILPVFNDPALPSRLTSVVGRTKALGENWELSFHVDDSYSDRVQNFYHAVLEGPGPEKLTDLVMSQLKLYQRSNQNQQAAIGLHMQPQNDASIIDPNFIILQIEAQVPFEFEVVFKSSDHKGSILSEGKYSDALQDRRNSFNDRFENTFHLKEKGFDEQSVQFAQAAMSNMIGGIGYFYGQSLVKSDLTGDPVEYWKAPLYTAVPSRSFFPRGFLWDEGFHNLLISKWNPQISSDIIAHWLDLINVEGWIPREQILGDEARAKVPAEFIVQHNKNANPPTLLLTLHSMVKDMTTRSKGGQTDSVPEWLKSDLQRFWPRLEAWYKWFNVTQAGESPGAYRWRGRNGTTHQELNPKTLTSGLDDFPRASHPTEDERHVDLRCWMALASLLMVNIAKIIGKTEAAREYQVTATLLSDPELLDSQHWSEEHQAYLDYGLHSENVILKTVPAGVHGQPSKKIRVVKTEARKRFVPQFGYVSLFPFILELLPVDSPKLPQILSSLEDPDKLFTPYGLRSLSKRASLYNKYNTEHDAPYWRGPIWLNINFLTVRALHNYAQRVSSEEVKSQLLRIYGKLRNALIQNVLKEYTRTGYIWEQYDDRTGRGKGCKPFTGWTALTVLIMGEIY